LRWRPRCWCSRGGSGCEAVRRLQRERDRDLGADVIAGTADHETIVAAELQIAVQVRITPTVTVEPVEVTVADMSRLLVAPGIASAVSMAVGAKLTWPPTAMG
jgi:hypothetical protein